MEKFYEIGKGRGRKCYYVFPMDVWSEDALREVARVTKEGKKNFKVIPVYIVKEKKRELLYLTEVPKSEMKLGVVKK